MEVSDIISKSELSQAVMNELKLSKIQDFTFTSRNALKLYNLSNFTVFAEMW
jgi:hypothetical protein